VFARVRARARVCVRVSSRLWYVRVAEGLVYVAQGHCAALSCTVWYSYKLYRGIAQHLIVLLGILVELHEVCLRCSLELVLQWCFRLCFFSLIY